MKFEKGVAELVFHFTGGHVTETTKSEFNLNPKELSKWIIDIHQRGFCLIVDGDTIDLESLESFEIVNYDELLERYDETLEDDTVDE